MAARYYAAGKEAARRTVAEAGIGISDVDVTVAPGTVMFPEDYTQDARESVLRRIPLGREGAPEDIARAVRFLVEEGGYVTGSVITVDGGKELGA